MRTLGHVVAVAPVVLVLNNCQPRASTELQGSAVEPLAEADGGSDVSGPSASVVFSHVFPGTGARSPAPNAIAVGPGGDIWVAGTFMTSLQLGSTMLTGTSGLDSFVARLDASAQPRWAARVDHEPMGLSVDADGNALVAIPGGLIKLDPNGEQLWQKSVLPIVGHDDGWVSVRSTAPDGAGGILLTGQLTGTIQAGASTLRSLGTSLFLARINGNGGIQWAFNVGPGADMDPIEMAADGAGNVVIGTRKTTMGSIRLAKVNASGSVYWGDFIGAVSDHVQLGAIAMDPQGDVVLSGSGRILPRGGSPVGADREPWIAKLGPSGNEFWPTSAWMGLLAMDDAGDVLYASGNSAGKLDRSGAQIWTYMPAITGGASIGAIAVTPAGRLVIAGSFSGSYDFGGGPVQSGAGGALFLVGLAR